jgi:hypothetical protein
LRDDLLDFGHGHLRKRTGRQERPHANEQHKTFFQTGVHRVVLLVQYQKRNRAPNSK